MAERGYDTTTQNAEVVIVGAGPGGCVLSYLLARSGVETVLLERHADLDREFHVPPRNDRDRPPIRGWRCRRRAQD